MSNIAAVLKQEIARLAAREVRRGTEKLRRFAAQHRRSIAALNRTIQQLRRDLTLATAQARRAISGPPAAEAATRTRFSASGLRARRKRLGLSADAFARLLDVSPQSVYNWERGITRPAPAQVAAIARARTIGKREARQRLEQLQAPRAKKRRKAR